MSAKFQLDNYVPVSERLEQFYADHPEGRILTSIVEHNEETGFVLMRAEAYRQQEDAVPAATGHAYESRGDGYVNKTSHIENCETSAVGRALALMGYEIKRGVASREEMQKVERMSTPRPTPVPTEKETLMKGVQDACKLLNQAGDVPPWTPARVREFVKNEMGAASPDDLAVEETQELLKRLSLRLDGLKGDKPSEKGPFCDCGIARVRKEGTKNGKKWAGFMCANKVKEHTPVWIDLEAEQKAELKQQMADDEEYDPDETADF